MESNILLEVKSFDKCMIIEDAGHAKNCGIGHRIRSISWVSIHTSADDMRTCHRLIEPKLNLIGRIIKIADDMILQLSRIKAIP
jgi:hypothetical protein